MTATFQVRLMFEWGGGCVRGGNQATRDRFDIGPIEDMLPLSPALRAELAALSQRHDGALDWDFPTGPSPWSVEEFVRFELAAEEARTKLVHELGPTFDVVYQPLG